MLGWTDDGFCSGSTLGSDFSGSSGCFDFALGSGLTFAGGFFLASVLALGTFLSALLEALEE